MFEVHIICGISVLGDGKFEASAVKMDLFILDSDIQIYRFEFVKHSHYATLGTEKMFGANLNVHKSRISYSFLLAVEGKQKISLL